MQIFQSNETYKLASGIESRILSVRTQSPLDKMILETFIHQIEHQSPPQLQYLGLEEHKPAYGAPLQTYKFAVPLTLLQDYSTPERLFITPPLFEKK